MLDGIFHIVTLVVMALVRAFTAFLLGTNVLAVLTNSQGMK